MFAVHLPPSTQGNKASEIANVEHVGKLPPLQSESGRRWTALLGATPPFGLKLHVKALRTLLEASPTVN